MFTEKEELSAIENELYFRGWNKKNGIELYLLDGDDTVWGMVEIFRKYQSECFAYLAQAAPRFSEEQWGKKILDKNDELFEIYAVNPKRWEEVISRVAEENQLSGEIQESALGILKKIYETPPRYLDEAENGLRFLKQTQTSFGIVTHANENWTWKKFEWLGLSEYLPWEDVYIVDENFHKTADSWRQAFSYFQCPAGNIAVIGDSPRSDINPSRQAGVKHSFLIENDVKRWSVHNQPVDQEVRIIRSIGDLTDFGRINFIRPK